MADDKGLNLNSLDRYAKHSPRFILEEYSHCEVPAGCGGVVLRWRDPKAGVPVEFWHYTPGKLEALFIDGVQQTISRPLVPPGQHVLGLCLTGVNPSAGFLMLAALYRAKGLAYHAHEDEKVQPHFVTVPDGSWRYTLAAPADDNWHDLDFQDSDWLPLVVRALPSLNERDYGEYRRKQIQEYNVQPLGFPEKQKTIIQPVKDTISPEQPDLLTVWVRKVFTILPEAYPLSLATRD
jgi:hypothetical protein